MPPSSRLVPSRKPNMSQINPKRLTATFLSTFVVSLSYFSGLRALLSCGNSVKVKLEYEPRNRRWNTRSLKIESLCRFRRSKYFCQHSMQKERNFYRRRRPKNPETLSCLILQTQVIQHLDCEVLFVSILVLCPSSLVSVWTSFCALLCSLLRSSRFIFLSFLILS